MLALAMYDHVLAVTDGSRESERAVAVASALAHEHHARLTVAAVVELEHPGRHCAYGSTSWNEVLCDAARADLERAGGLIDVPAKLEIFFGKPLEAVADGARALGCDVIVVAGPPHGIGKVLHRDRTTALRRRVTCEVIQPR
jgi:nucleotide-binding universal stress UspA family protein